MSINGLSGATTAATTPSTQRAAPSTPPAGNQKTLYGDPSRAEGLMNMMNIMKRLPETAQALVSSRNSSLQ